MPPLLNVQIGPLHFLFGLICLSGFVESLQKVMYTVLYMTFWSEKFCVCDKIPAGDSWIMLQNLTQSQYPHINWINTEG